MIAKRLRPLALLLAALAAVSLGALFVGPVAGWDRAIVLEIRLPRVLLGIIVGMALAAAGATFQGLLRNPLADPFILGTSSAAAFGVTLAAVLGIGFYQGIYFFSISFSLLAIFMVYRIARLDGRAPVQTLVLSGVIVSTFFSALVLLCLSLFYLESFSAMFFLMGTLAEGDPLLIKTSAAIILTGFLVTMAFARDLNVMTQGEEAALHLGLDVEMVKKALFVIASSMVAAAVAVSGMIGFIGLIVPHIMRALLGADHRVLIPASALGGALFLVFVDTLARTVAAPRELPVGVITALCGAPFFIYLLRKRRAGLF